MVPASVKDPNQSALSYFPPRFYWVREHPLKDLSYYTNILKETNSIHFKPIFDKTDTTKLLYHSVYFDKLIHLKDWGDHPSKPRMLENSNLSYSYYDNQDAWFKFLLSQNPRFDHSWFINFGKLNLVGSFLYGFPTNGGDSSEQSCIFSL
jgi:hypothetical protein